MLPAWPRLPEVNAIINEKKYFVLRSPAKSGKSTLIRSLVNEINMAGQYYAEYCSFEGFDEIEDPQACIAAIAIMINIAMHCSKSDSIQKAYIPLNDLKRQNQDLDNNNIISELLKEICRLLDKEFIFFFDDVHYLNDDCLLGFLSQLQNGFTQRSSIPFLRSLALVGMRNPLDFKAKTSPDYESILSSGPFNSANYFTMANFTLQEMASLYAQHTEATGQIFMQEAVLRAWYWSDGQPWLSNALAKEAVEKMETKFSAIPITAKQIDNAAKAIIKSRGRDSHISYILKRMKEDRVIRALDLVLGGTYSKGADTDEDIGYSLDLGIVKYDSEGHLCLANPIYLALCK
jgi:hypothetical protein